jgi:hypothetical protein
MNLPPFFIVLTMVDPPKAKAMHVLFDDEAV